LHASPAVSRPFSWAAKVSCVGSVSGWSPPLLCVYIHTYIHTRTHVSRDLSNCTRSHVFPACLLTARVPTRALLPPLVALLPPSLFLRACHARMQTLGAWDGHIHAWCVYAMSGVACFSRLACLVWLVCWGCRDRGPRTVGGSVWVQTRAPVLPGNNKRHD